VDLLPILRKIALSKALPNKALKWENLQLALSIFLYTGQFIHAAFHLALTVYLILKLKGIKT